MQTYTSTRGGRVFATMDTAPPPPEGDAAIIESMQSGSVSGLEALLRTHGEHVKGCLRVAFGLRSGDHALEDAVHDAAQALFLRAKRLDPRQNLGGYYYRTARRDLVRLLRARRGHKQLWPGAEEQLAAPDRDEDEPCDLTARIAAMIERLPVLEREILVLDQAHNFTMKAREIARLLKTTEATVYSLRNRTKGRFAGFLEPRDGMPGEP